MSCEIKILKLSLKSPVSFNLPLQYVFIEKFLKKQGLEEQDITVLTNAKKIVSFVQDQEEVSPVPGLTFDEAKTAWRNVAHPALQNKLKDLAWMALHEVLPVRAVMHSRGMARTSVCPRPGCGLPETVRHVLWECSAARDLWTALGPLQSPSLPAAGALHASFRLAASGVSRGANTVTAADFPALWLTLNSVKAALWASRNLLVGKRVSVPLPAVMRLVTTTRQEAPDVAIRKGGPRSTAGRVPNPTASGSRRRSPTNTTGRSSGLGGDLR